MQKNIIPFDYDSNLIRVVPDEEGNPWWVAKDVCKAIELSDASKAVQNLDDDEKGATKVRTLKGKQTVIIINEPGLYTLIIRSNKPEAKAFKRWITHEVLPGIRKTGGYQMPSNEAYLDGSMAKRAGNMYFPMAKLVESADKFLEGKAALTALNYFTGMPVDDLLAELEEKQADKLDAGQNLKGMVNDISTAKELVGEFMAEACEFKDEYKVNATVAYNAFCRWCRDRDMKKMITRKRFGTVVSAGFEKFKSGSVFYVGFRLKQD